MRDSIAGALKNHGVATTFLYDLQTAGQAETAIYCQAVSVSAKK